MRPGIENLLLLIRRKIVIPIQSLTQRMKVSETIQPGLLKSSRLPSRTEGFLAADLPQTRYCPGRPPEGKITGKHPQSKIGLESMLVEEVLRYPYKLGIGPASWHYKH